MALPVGAKTFNVIRSGMSQVYMNELPSATKDNILTLKNILFNDSYQPMLNEFVSNLVNRIGLTIVRNKTFSNPLALFKKGSMPLGTDIQELYTNPAQAEQYELSNTEMAKLLSITDPDTHVAYYRRNRKDMYTKTISREELMGAFVSWDKFEDYITSITNSLYAGNYIDEFKYTKALIDGAYENNKVIVQTVTAPTDESTSKAFVKKVRGLFSKMSFPSTSYNAYSKFSGAQGTITTWTDPERVVLIITADALANVEVETLAQAFNLSYADMKARIITVDAFDNSNIVAVVCDEAWLQIYDNLFRFDEFYNARVMAWNEYLHAWNTYAISPFANAVCLATANPVDLTGITLDAGGSGITLNLADATPEEEITVTLAPVGATTPIVYTSSNEAVFGVEKLANNKIKVIPYNIGTGTLKATGANNVQDTAEITVINDPSA